MLAFKEKGNGYPVVLLHAFPLDSEMWFPQMPLANEKFRFLCLDLPSFGESAPLDENSLENIAKKVLQTLDSLKIEKAAIGGLSMGGYVTFNLYRIAPERFFAVLLFDTSPLADTEEKRNSRFELINEVEQKGSFALIEKMLPNLISEHTKNENQSLVEWLKEKFSKTNPKGVVKALEAMAHRKDHSYMLKDISVPTLLIFGEHDNVTNLEIAEKMRSEIPNAELHKIPKAGHYSNLENPEAFNSALKNFLENSL